MTLAYLPSPPDGVRYLGPVPIRAPAHRPPDTPLIATYHPTFRYESLRDIGVAVLLIWAGPDRGPARRRASSAGDGPVEAADQRS